MSSVHHVSLPGPILSANWLGTVVPGSLTRLPGLASLFPAFLSQAYVVESAKLLVVGSIIETGRRIFRWVVERFRLQFSITAQFDEGDPSYDWIILFLTQEKVWKHSHDFRVSATTSKRIWSVKQDAEVDAKVDYVPTYEHPQLFRWKGYWIEIKRNKSTASAPSQPGGPTSAATLYLTIYTLKMSALQSLVEEARLRYVEVSRPHVIVHTIDPLHLHMNTNPWNNVKRKARRPLLSIILPEGLAESLVADANDFIDTEDWYIGAGIPHRRGYLLHGPPGTGKSSTIYALAGALNFEIYSLSLSSGFIDDSFLERAVSNIPKHSIFLIEDIDCAFPSREDEEEEAVNMMPFPGMPPPFHSHSKPRSPVTLSGLLNVLDGVGSDEGKLFFATTNYIDRLDAALLRPGRVDKKIEYHLATQAQALALFLRFFPEDRFNLADTPIRALATQFASALPEHEFSTAELQGFLLSCKSRPRDAAVGLAAWVDEERADRIARAAREEARKERYRAARERMNGGMSMGGPYAASPMGLLPPPVPGPSAPPLATTPPQVSLSLPSSVRSETPPPKAGGESQADSVPSLVTPEYTKL